MLAYELFYKNKNSSTGNVKTELPIKKIFYKNGEITIDEKNLENYSSETTKKTEQLQKYLVMPLNTVQELNLPYHRTGGNSANPYIEIYGILQTNRSCESKLSLSIRKKKNYINHILDLTKDKIESLSEGTVRLNLDRKKYFLNSNTLFSEYVQSKIIDDTGIINAEIYDKIIQKFLEFVKTQKPIFTKVGKTNFRIYILPNDSAIEYKKESEKEDLTQESFVDYFGNNSTNYASTPTETAKFLSYDDKAFTINCMVKTDFYRNLGIGSGSLDKIFTDPAQTFVINRLYWTFTDISDGNSNSKFEDTKQGILTQLHKNYLQFPVIGDNTKFRLKILCIRINQAKQELLIDENLTMDKMKKMFLGMKHIPPLCFEKVLIDNSGEKPIWNVYLYVVKNFLAGNKVPKDYLLSFFNKTLKQERFNWIKSKNSVIEPKDFFLRTNFCLKHLINNDKENIIMHQNEEFAKKIGQMARAYIVFKQTDEDNSLYDILTYSKYDRERLRFVLTRIGRGIQLAKVSVVAKKQITDRITSIQPNEEIDDDSSSKDYSYFFFKGYYVNERLVA